MNSLKIKILGIISAAALVAVGLTTWSNIRHQQELVSQIATQNIQMLADTVRNSIRTAMAAGENAEVSNILSSIQRDRSIEAIRIFSPDGKILRSSNPDEIGEQALPPAFSTETTIIATEEHSHFHSTTAIKNAQACTGCHDPAQPVLGILDIELTFETIEELTAASTRNMIFASMIMMAVIFAVLLTFFLVYIDTPIRRLIAAMRTAEAGEFSSARISITSSSEMALLSEKFSLMLERVASLMQAKVEQEKELAVREEQLLHQEELQSMNSSLEERLKEIEYLNITLEERIEEIEEANYKIADLASDLESKNTTLQRTVERLSAMYKMGLALNSTMEISKLFNLLLRKTSETLRAKVGYLLLMNTDRKSLRVAASLGIPTIEDPDFAIPLRPGGVSHWVVDTGEPLLLTSANDSDFNKTSLLGFDRQSVICTPLKIKGEIVGTLTVANTLDNTPFTPDDLELLSTIGAQASVAINNAQLYEEQEQTYLNTVQALVTAIEASDAYTRGHSERVTRYSVAIGQAMGLPANVMYRLERAAVLHDIGKIGINIELLHKEGKLSSSDIDQLQLHPMIGAKIIEPVHFLRDVREIIVQHHERFDGKGYPNRLKEEDIRLEARILAVADTYDAMTSDRPYRKALSHEIAIQELVDHSGTQFDPAVVQTFVSLSQGGAPSPLFERAVGSN